MECLTAAAFACNYAYTLRAHFRDGPARISIVGTGHTSDTEHMGPDRVCGGRGFLKQARGLGGG